MKLTKKIEAEIHEACDAFWGTYLSGDLKAMASLLADEYVLIGTSEGEVFHDKKSAMKYIKATINQLVGVFSRKNVERDIRPMGDVVVVREFFDAYINEDGQPAFYNKSRITTVLKRVRGQWKFIHHHGSLPDSKAESGEAIGSEKVKKENRELREAVKRRTRELELKNRDLEIEAALERVRGRTMAMHRSDELREVVNVLYEQLRQLGFRYGGANIALMDPNSGDMHWWMSGFGVDEFPDSYLVKYFNHPALDEMLHRWKKGEKFASVSLAGKSKKKFDQSFLFKSDFSRIPEKIKRELANLESATFSLAYMKYGALNIGAEPITSTQAEILQRFAIVFEQTYTRFLDLQKAEAQTREAQIELGLERVRARAMAMQSSTELGALIGMIYTELTRLDMNLNRCFIVLFDDSGNSTWWMASTESTALNRGYYVPYREHPFNLACLNGWRGQDLTWRYVLTGKGKKSWDAYIFGKTEMALVPQFIIENMRAFPTANLAASFNKYGCVMAATTSTPLPLSSFDLIIKFSRTFEQTYTRFLDLKNAEAQTRESQIQLALERVRARTMAMQHSDELQEAANLLFKQVQSLEIPVWSCGFNIWEIGEKICTGWMSTNDVIQPPFKIPLTESPTFIRFYKSRKKNEDFYVEKVEGNVLAAHYKYMLSLPDFARIVEKRIRVGFKLPKSQINHVANFAHGNLVFITSEPVPDAWEIFKRFAKVFEQTYTRFLDLKKAEAQAQEAQIEAALEKIRSRSLAMHRSDEVRDVVFILFKKLGELKVVHDTVAIQLFDFKTKDSIFWPGNDLSEEPHKIILPFDEKMMEANTCHRDLWQAMANGEVIFNKVYSKEQKDIWFQYVFLHNDIEEHAREFMTQANTHTVCFIPGKKSALFADSFDGTCYTEQEMDVLKRAARVFEQAYIRFLDLQTAEAQAREALIEAALEKVRSSSMGMHHSDELEKVVSVLFDKLSELGLSFDGALIYNFDKEKRNLQLWVASKLLPAPVKVKLPHNDEIAKNPIIADLWQAIEKGEHVINRSYSGKVKDDYFLYVAKNNENNVSQFVLDLQFQSYTISFAAEKNSIVGFDSWTGQMTSDQDFQVIRRFAGVFEQAYTRFLDLQRAEAQARESQIQLALERVRARTMAMQKSDELKEVAMLLFKQVADLGITCWTTGFNVWSEDGNSYVDYVTNPMGGFMEPYTVDTTRFAVIRDVSAARKKGDTFYVGLETGDRQKETYSHLTEFGDKDQYGKILESGFRFPSQQVNHFVFGDKVSLLFVTYDHVPEAHDIFKRFGKAFELTFTRFLDLEKAEAQARESRIQLALERVRARTMAMQKSHELADVAELLFQQVSDLGIKTWTTGFNIWLNEDTAYEDWITNPQGGFIEPYIVDTTQFPIFIGTREAKQRGDEFLVQYVDGELIEETYKELTRIAPAQFEKLLQQGFKFPSQQYDHFVFGSKVSLMFITYEPVPEAHEIFKRFGKVFEQTYTRFLDLKKAEAQAHEAQIEAALEKVRARTMGMQRSDELSETAALMFQQVKSFGFELWNCGFNIWEKDKDECTTWMSTPEGKLIPPSQLPLTEHPVFIKMKETRKDGVDFYVEETGGKGLEEFYQYLKKLPVLGKGLREFIDQGGQVPTFQIEHVVNFSQGNLIFITYKAYPEAHDIFKRFGKVFEQTYTRFLDLQNAEAQARESQIQLALERVRARTMAMQRSDELAEAAVLMFQQIKSFGLELWGCGFNIWEKDEKECMGWMSSPDGGIVPPVKIPLTEHPVFIKFYESRQKGIEFYTYERGAKELGEFYEYLVTVQEALKEYLDSGGSVPTFQIDHVVNFAHGNLIFITYKAYPEAHDIFKRFGKVFEQTYTRFLDLKNAEAQVREAQIEAALEKVRSSSLAMHHSDELEKVITVLFDKLLDLGLNIDGAAINIFDKGKRSSQAWVATKFLSGAVKVNLPYDDEITKNAIIADMWRALETGEHVFNRSYSGNAKDDYFRFIFKNNESKIPEETAKFHLEAANWTVTWAAAPNSIVLLDSWSGKLSSDEDFKVLKRFSRVFDQAYTRFLDLQKAEAQAREAHIEAALERVRSRTMAMHKSEELLDVIAVVSEQLQHVGLKFNTVSFGKNTSSFDMDFWVAAPDLKFPIKIHAPFANISIYVRLKEAFRERRTYFSDTFTAEETKVWNQHIIDHNPELFSQKSREYLTSRPGMTRSTVLLKNVFLFLINYDFVTYSNEEIEIVIRFANVFEQTYTRFLDLQKAEAQAREAQIEASLERLRSRTMAMQRSTELAEVSKLLHQQFLSLGVETITCAFMFPNEEKKTQSGWSVLPDGVLLPTLLDFPLLGDSILDERYSSWKEKRSLHRKVLDIEENRRHHQFLSEQVASHISKDIFAQLPDQLTFTNANFAQGYLMTFTTAPLAAEEENILVRFAKVFEQTYTRFLDLQKAEAQAREAQIESALEKIRSRSLAMHHSGELKDVVAIMFEKMKELNVVIGTIAIQLFDQNTMNSTFWAGNNLHDEPPRVKLPYYEKMLEEDGYMKDSWDCKKKGENIINKEYTFEQKTRFFDHVFASNDLATISEADRDVIRQSVISPPNGHIVCLINEKNSSVFADSWNGEFYSDESIKVLIRAAKVFEQAYVRFLDLQKAEAQARESQIEAALERVRSRTMAMHKSEELLDVIVVVSQQLTHLDFRFDVVSFARTSEMHDYRYWFCLENASRAFEMHVPYLDNPMFERVKRAMSQGAKFLADTLTVAENREWVEHMLAHGAWPDITNEVKDFLLSRGYARSIVFMPQIMLFLGNYYLKPYSAEQNNILKRFAAVFEQSYTRFLDLQKAEAQAREAQIEAALERVRAKAMAMHTAQQLSEVVHELRTQMGLLGQKDLNTCVIHLNDESPDFVRTWAAIRRPDTNDEISEFSIEVPKRGLTIIEDALKAYAASQQDYVLIAEGEKAKQWMEFGKMALPEAFALTKGPSYDFSVQSYWSFSDFQGGSLIMITFETPDENSRALLRRFANVFGLAYRRFADLKQAEDQAREAQIEAALERVRSRAMAMHTAQQLTDVVHELRKQMGLLGQKDLETCVIHLNDESPDFIEAWAASRLPNRSDEIQEFHVMIPKRGLKIIEESMEAYSANRKDYVMKNDGARLDEWIEFMRESVPGAHALMVESINSTAHEIGKRAYWSFADFQGGSMLMVTLAEPDESSRALLRRFSNVFGLAYRRFADLKQAEAQAREATIETALEKIRSRSLGMHKSEEIKDVVAILFEKLKELGLVFDGGAAIHLFSEGSRDASILVAAPQLMSEPVRQYLPFDENDFADNPIILDVWRARETGESIVNKHYPFEQKNKYFQYVFKHNPETPPEEVKKFIMQADSYTATFISEKNSLLGANSWTEQKFSDDDVVVLKRVARVFEQAYVRFLDLQKAEAQAKEATIEAALEKIRSRSLGMHQSEELKDVVAILFEKLKELDLPFDGGAGLFLFPEGSRDTYLWVTNGHVPPVCNYLPYDKHDFSDNSVMQDVWKAKDTGEPLVSKHYSSEEKNKLFSYTSEHNDETKIPEAERQRVFEANSYTATFIPEKNSLLSIDSWTKQIMSASDIEVLKRVARVFEQAYVRFLDLQKAEVHAREAVCQASLDRVRAEIASMRTVEDLDRITPLIWRELNTIGIPSIRCGVFIMDEPNHIVHTFLSTPDGKAIGVFHLPFDVPGFVDSIVKHWRDKKAFLDYWDNAAKNNVAETFVKRGLFASVQQYLDILPKEGFHLHFLPFAQGMLYVGNLTKLKDEELTLLQSLADAFATAYARYDDFNKLESAKQQVDRTLIDLKQAQQQLVQSEKMASLGELTAGIAHEIQNPLNFVNNFSEVSNELIEEMKTELQAGNLKDAAELAESIKQNLEKITHHGKRADGIVKGMLQHSRAGSGQKEPTDLNFLCDEYLRLAYHGYRAKEKSFNAKFESSFDPTLPKANVVGQDIGRVILNLINNAFYAVTEMKRKKTDGYEPIVSVITKNLSGKVEIRVKDNGIGISEKVLEKIFQPFFTTKPTGQGTGLGLSLSYDIIKAHGGTLEVSSKQGEGSEFIIQLPV